MSGKKAKDIPNPEGRADKPLSLAALTVEEALRKALSISPEKLAELKASEKKTKKAATKK
jgi:hypothetical protein